MLAIATTRENRKRVNGLKNKGSSQFSRWPRMEILEDRKLLTTLHALDPVMVDTGSSAQVCYAVSPLASAPVTESTTEQSGAASRSSGKGGGKPPTAEIVVSPVNPSTLGLTTAENGRWDEFQVRLGSQPTADVTIALHVPPLTPDVSPYPTTEATLSLNELVFTADNWNIPQAVRVTGADDAFVDGNLQYWVVLNAASSSDPQYDGIDPDDVQLTSIDDETPVANALYVRNFELSDTRTRGKSTEYQFQVDVGLSGGGNAAGVQVVISVYNSDQTNLNSDSNIRNFLGTTDSNGIFRTSWLRLEPGEYHIEVHDLALAGYYWDPLDELDAGTDEDGDTRPDFVLSV